MNMQKGTMSIRRGLALLCAFIFVVSIALTGCSRTRSQSTDTEANVTDAGVSGAQNEQVPISSGTYTVENTTKNPNMTSGFVTAAGGGSAGGTGSSGGSSGGSYNGGSGYGGSSGGASYNGSSSGGSSAGNSHGGSSGSSGGATAATTVTGDSVYNDVAWQRKFGFNAGYDAFTGIAGFNIEELCTYFTYGNKDWLLEFWKGEYEFVTLGGEIGIYYHNNKTGNPPSNPKLYHYKAVEDSDALYMSMDLWQRDSKGDRHVITRSRMKCWWLAAFEAGTLEKHTRRSDLVLVGSVQFKNNDMMDAFVASFSKKGFTKKMSKPTYRDDDAYFADRSSATVYFSWRYVQNS